MNVADTYVGMAVFAISVAETSSDLRRWWSDEQRHRLDYGLSDAQIDHLISLCKSRVAVLGEDNATSTQKTAPPRRRRTALI